MFLDAGIPILSPAHPDFKTGLMCRSIRFDQPIRGNKDKGFGRSIPKSSLPKPSREIYSIDLNQFQKRSFVLSFCLKTKKGKGEVGKIQNPIYIHSSMKINLLMILHTVHGDDRAVMVHHEPPAIVEFKHIGDAERTASHVMVSDHGDPSHVGQNPGPDIKGLYVKPYLPVIETKLPSLHHRVVPITRAFIYSQVTADKTHPSNRLHKCTVFSNALKKPKISSKGDTLHPLQDHYQETIIE